MSDLFELFYQCDGLSTDTRSIGKNHLFVCLLGERYDANEFALEALEKGAKYVVSSKLSICDEKKIFYTSDTLLYLQNLARQHRRKYNIPVVGITGSNGKTTSKELIQAVLSTHYETMATIGNLNNHIGVPLTLLRLKQETEIAIVEMGANKPGDIEVLCHIAEPNYGYITNIGKAHLEGFGSYEGVLKTKTELFHSVNQNNGVLFYHSDDQVISNQIPNLNKAISFSSSKGGNLLGKLIHSNPFISFSYQTPDYQSPVIETNLVGAYNLTNFLAAISMGIYFKVPFEKINDALSNYKPQNNRSQVEKTSRNTLIVDCYNANPSSMSLALDSFSKAEFSSKLAILGDMMELGPQSAEEHLSILEQCQTHGIETITVGKIFKDLNTGKAFESHLELIESGQLTEISGKLILIKGSRSIGLEKIIAFL